MASKSDGQEIFDNLLSKFSQLLYGRKEDDRSRINKALDDLNSLDYRYLIVTNPIKAVLLVNQCCTLIPPDDSLLVAKCCHLISNLVNCQHLVVEGRTLTLTVEWCLQSLKQSNGVVAIDVLVTLDALVRSNPQNRNDIVNIIVSPESSIVNLAENSESLEIVLLAVQCLESCCSSTENVVKTSKERSQLQLELCYKVFLKYLLSEKAAKFDPLLYSKLLISCIKGVQNITTQDKSLVEKDLGLLLGIVKSYMVYGIKDIGFSIPQKIMPSSLSIPEPVVNSPVERRGGKITKQRKHRKNANAKEEANKSEESIEYTWGYVPGNSGYESTSKSSLNAPLLSAKLKTSDSDFSDTEGGRKAKLSVTEGRVRQAALNLLLSITKAVERRVLFSYWSSLIPDSPSSGTHYLTTCVLRDPSPRGRMAALNVLLILLINSKLYLSQAESSTKTSAFTPLSAILAFTIEELHRCLCLAVNESSVPVLHQVLKCLAALIQTSPYHRLKQGYITKIVRNVKGLIYHKDPTIQVAALIVLGCLLASEPLVPETKEVFLNVPPEQNVPQAKSANANISKDDFDYAVFSSDEEDEIMKDTTTEIPWLLQKCLNNLGVKVTEENVLVKRIVPAPVKLETLQVLSAMSRHYFSTLMVPYVHLIVKALDISLADKYTDLRLHAGRTLDFVGQAMNLYLTSTETDNSAFLDTAVQVWLVLLNGPLVSLLQEDQNPALRAIGCDCFGSIGSLVFERLPADKQILIVTQLFGCSRDEEYHVKASSVRALAICVLYPSLREDSGFVVDTAEVIHRTLQDEYVFVRIKASWALGNLSDALVLNRPNLDEFDGIPSSLLLNLLEAGIKCCSDNDKIKMNSVRALGNFLLLITTDLIKKISFRDAAVRAIDALVKNASRVLNMKVRWNSCYAINNMLKNPVLYENGNNWQNQVFSTLMDLVINCKNFKVRIHAALALSAPTNRDFYGQFYMPIWTALLKAIENSQNMEDFTEYKHRDHLVDQICLTIGHLTTVLRADDLAHLKDVVACHIDTLKTHMHRVIERLVPEKLTDLYAAKAAVATLQLQDLTEENKKLLNLLSDVLYTICK